MSDSDAAGAFTVSVDEKRFVSQGREYRALADFRLRVEPGEFVCLVGPSGCGKSTLINIINGLDRDYRGTVSTTGVDPPRRLRRRADGHRTVATMFQTPRLMPWLTVLDNILLVLDDGRAGAARNANVQRARELLAAMRLDERRDAYPKQLSGGMQRRVALARAFAIRPRLLLMDEPFVSLDQPTANRLRTMLIEQWQRERASVLFVTHDLREALALADRVVFSSASPGRVMLELPLDLARPRDPDSAEVTALQRRLLTDHPALLDGVASPPQT